MVLTTLVIVAVLFVGYILMSTEHINHINRAAVAMFCGVVAWVIYMFNAGTYLDLVHPESLPTALLCVTWVRHVL